MDITLRQLNYFIALAETRHFGRAAERVHVSQPALSVQIRELEDRLGAVLVDRSARGLALTSAGREVLGSARRVMRELQGMESIVRWQDGLSGRLKLGLIPTVAPYLLPVVLPRLRARDLTLDVRIRETQTADLLADLADGHLDAAVMALPSGQSGLIELPLFDDRFLLAGSKSQIERLSQDTDSLRPATLSPDRLLLLDEGHCLADQALDVCGLPRSATRLDLGASSLGTLSGLAAEGFGLTFLPEIALASESAAIPDLATVRFSKPEPFRTIGLVRWPSSGDDTWFRELAAILAEAGTDLLRSHATAA